MQLDKRVIWRLEGWENSKAFWVRSPPRAEKLGTSQRIFSVFVFVFCYILRSVITQEISAIADWKSNCEDRDNCDWCLTLEKRSADVQRARTWEISESERRDLYKRGIRVSFLVIWTTLRIGNESRVWPICDIQCCKLHPYGFCRL